MKNRSLLLGIHSIGLAVPVVWVGCQGNVLQLGSNDDAGAVSASFQNDGSTVTGDAGDDGGPEETWTGYVEDYQFPSGSDAVSMTFHVSSTGIVTGHVRFGDLPLFPPPTNPKVGYPYDDEDIDAGTDDLFVVEGFEFTLRDASRLNDRFLAGFAPAELQAQWCTLQMPILDTINPGQTYNCIPNASWGNNVPGPGCFLGLADGGKDFIDCEKLELCQSRTVCACDASVCATAVPATETGHAFDLVVDGNRADGSFALFQDTKTVHLTRQ